MVRRFPFTSLFAAIVLFALAARAEVAPAPAEESTGIAPGQSAANVGTGRPAVAPRTNPIVVAPGAERPDTLKPPPKPRRMRAISPEVAAQLAAAAPKFTPPPPKPPEPEEEVDLRDIDKPKNGIIRLPKFVVREPPPPVFSERALYTQKGLADLAVERYISETYRALNPFALPLFGTSAESQAMRMYEEDERLKNMKDLEESARMIRAGDKAAGDAVQREIDRTFLRTEDFGWEASRR